MPNKITLKANNTVDFKGAKINLYELVKPFKGEDYIEFQGTIDKSPFGGSYYVDEKQLKIIFHGRARVEDESNKRRTLRELFKTANFKI